MTRLKVWLLAWVRSFLHTFFLFTFLHYPYSLIIYTRTHLPPWFLEVISVLPFWRHLCFVFSFFLPSSFSSLISERPKLRSTSSASYLRIYFFLLVSNGKGGGCVHRIITEWMELVHAGKKARYGLDFVVVSSSSGSLHLFFAASKRRSEETREKKKSKAKKT